MIRLAFYFRDSQEIDRRSQKPSGALVESSKATNTKTEKVSTLRGPAQLADLQRVLCVSALYPYTCLFLSFAFLRFILVQVKLFAIRIRNTTE